MTTTEEIIVFSINQRQLVAPAPPPPPPVPGPVVAHGFDDDDETRRLLRSRPPRAALAWAEQELGGTVTSARALRGGGATAVHLLSVTCAGDAVERVVLRRYVRREDVIEEPDLAEREARALELVAGLDLGGAVATPRLLAVDPTGASAGVPALLMSRIAGRPQWFPRDLHRWLERLARPLPGIHSAPAPPAGVVRPFAPYRQERYEPPAWARWPRVWSRAIELFHLPTPNDAGPAVFTHRDYHPGNVLWRWGSVTGVVDWASASVGPACVDVGHCRGNLFQYGLEAAERFTAIWEGLTGSHYHPWADVVTIVGSLDGLRDDPGPDRFLVEEALARAVVLLGRGP